MNVGAVVGWKTNHHPGISTRANVITAWPDDAPFPQPDAATLSQWEAEFNARPTPQPIEDARGNSVPELRAEFNDLIAELRRIGTIES